MKGKIFLILLLTVIVSPTVSQTRRLSRAAIDSIQTMRNIKNDNRFIRFVQYKHDIGTVRENDTVYLCNYEFYNVSNRHIELERVNSNCGCATVHYDTLSIAPGGKGRIVVGFNPKGKAGTIDTDIFVYLHEDTGKPSARLVLTGNVIGTDEWDWLPVQMGELRLKSRTVTFDISNGILQTERIVCANTSTTPITLSAKILPPYIAVRCEPETLQPGEEGNVAISLLADKIPYANVSDTIKNRVILEGITSRPSLRTIEITINR